MTEFRAGDVVSLKAIVEDVNTTGIGALVRIGNHRAFRVSEDDLTMVSAYFMPDDSVWHDDGTPLKVLGTHGRQVWVLNPDNEALTFHSFELSREAPRMTEQELADGIDALTPPPAPAPDPDQAEIPF